MTICTRNRECLFGEIINKEMVLNDAGEMVIKIWNNKIGFNVDVEMREFILMPNHFHDIIRLDVGVPLVGTLSLLSFVYMHACLPKGRCKTCP